MKVVILAGGFGTRLSEQTVSVPKPMIRIGGRPLLEHLMDCYARAGHNDFYIALGYKAEIIKDFFLNYHILSSDFTIELSSGMLNQHAVTVPDWKVTLIDTGINTMTGGRIKRLKSYVEKEPFLLTYGDGLSNVNIENLIKFHNSHKKMVTVTAVRPSARFGELLLNGDDGVTTFSEKPQITEGWINGGFFVVNPEFLDFIEGDHTFLEKAPLEMAANQGELMAYKHEGFWQCMDTKRDHDYLEELWSAGAPPWTICA
jgi:glucose-1-phosphate cytidylyltransferase